MKIFLIPYIIVILLVIIITVAYFYENRYIVESNDSSNYYYLKAYDYQWPVIGYNTITSEFGNRQAPTKGSSTYHTGIDIAAPSGANIVSSIKGYISFVGFSGAGGHTIKVKKDNIEVIYCHVDSAYYPVLGKYVDKGEVIGRVGPKNIYDVTNNPYKDSKGNPTNGATTGSHLHFSIKINNSFVNPLNIMND